MKMVKDFRKTLTAIVSIFVLIGGVWGGIAALNATFATKAFAESLLKQVQANTKRLNIKITEDKIYNLNRTKYDFVIRFGKDCKDCQIIDEQIAKLKRELARQ